MADRQLLQQTLDLIPHQPPFRFIDDILDADETAITATYRFREDESFYKGHFPENPITPGVILIETMAQTGVVAMGIYQLLTQGILTHEIKQITTLFAIADSVEFTGMVLPGEEVIISGEMMYLRKRNIKAKTHISRQNGEIVCSGILTGAGVKIKASQELNR